MKDVSVVPKMKASQKTKVLTNEFGGGTIKILVRSLEDAFKALHRPTRGNKEVLPRVSTPQQCAYKDYLLVHIDKKMGIRKIENLLEGRGVEHADILLFLALQEEKVTMGDPAPAVMFWKNTETGEWYHCLCALDKKTGTRFVEFGPVWRQYPAQTTVVVVLLLS